MFERFTKDARRVVVLAQEDARMLNHHHIGTEHLLLAFCAHDNAMRATLRAHGLEASDLRQRIVRHVDDPLDPEALRTLGIDLDAVREATEEAFGEGALDAPRGRKGRPNGHIPFTPKAKKALELSLRHAVRLKQKEINAGHILLGILHDDDFLSVRLATEAGVDVAELRADVTRLLTSEAA
ncbi:Clp protease N-terminal domain-containing protein [Actinomadura sp. NTSP31]|uniref:Clp protease N-terminal domain-containing protein n=1 Tax=Actinomadura sp. NTSP31 TaxID=1735447 RepID=UPI0035C1EF30